MVGRRNKERPFSSSSSVFPTCSSESGNVLLGYVVEGEGGGGGRGNEFWFLLGATEKSPDHEGEGKEAGERCRKWSLLRPLCPPPRPPVGGGRTQSENLSKSCPFPSPHPSSSSSVLLAWLALVPLLGTHFFFWRMGGGGGGSLEARRFSDEIGRRAENRGGALVLRVLVAFFPYGRRRNGDGILALPPPLLCRRLEGREVPLESPSFTPTPTSRHNSRLLLLLLRPPPCRQKCLPRKSNLAQN